MALRLTVTWSVPQKTIGVLLLLNRHKSIFCKSIFDALDALHTIVAGVQLDNHLFDALQIFWRQKRIFGTFNGNAHVARIGNGSGQALSLKDQLMLPFRSNDVLKAL